MAGQFGLRFRLPRKSHGSFTCRKSVTWDRRLYFPSEGRHAVDFFTRKIWRLRPSSNPRSWVPESTARTLTLFLSGAIPVVYVLIRIREISRTQHYWNFYIYYIVWCELLALVAVPTATNARISHQKLIVKCLLKMDAWRPKHVEDLRHKVIGNESVLSWLRYCDT
jgi:hypothetical protein